MSNELGFLICKSVVLGFSILLTGVATGSLLIIFVQPIRSSSIKIRFKHIQRKHLVKILYRYLIH